jgi:uroporphyrin-III C-methyltransferase/precorrin-2 dehydrogenase/sirohydrochlorin ferrochelatase
MNGFVSLVGAGPGDPDLLTVKAVRRLAEAEVVLYDALVSPAVLALAPAAHRFFVGKRARRKAMRQETIHWLLIRAARRGKRVVRLKCGDPFVFGRGGEEALALVKAGIPFEVVPGVSSAVAAPALAGIPVTHRGLSSGFVVVSGHSETAYGPVLRELSPQSLTIVVLMGLASRGAIASFLIARGWRPDTPAALLLGASTPDSAVWTGTLESLRSAALETRGDAPGTLVIGDVVTVAAELALHDSPAAAAAVSRGQK